MFHISPAAAYQIWGITGSVISAAGFLFSLHQVRKNRSAPGWYLGPDYPPVILDGFEFEMVRVDP